MAAKTGAVVMKTMATPAFLSLGFSWMSGPPFTHNQAIIILFHLHAWVDSDLNGACLAHECGALGVFTSRCAADRPKWTQNGEFRCAIQNEALTVSLVFVAR